jgi:hypothetical protein
VCVHSQITNALFEVGDSFEGICRTLNAARFRYELVFHHERHLVAFRGDFVDFEIGHAPAARRRRAVE